MINCIFSSIMVIQKLESAVFPCYLWGVVTLPNFHRWLNLQLKKTRNIFVSLHSKYKPRAVKLSHQILISPYTLTNSM